MERCEFISGFRSYSVCQLPENWELAAFGASWFGQEMAEDTLYAQPNAERTLRFKLAARTFGSHRTLKPPFQLVHRYALTS